MTLAWDGLSELAGYQVTEIPRRPDAGTSEAPQERPNDSGRTQRFAALVAAYHAGAETENGNTGVPANGHTGALAIGWVRLIDQLRLPRLGIRQHTEVGSGLQPQIIRLAGMVLGRIEILFRVRRCL